MKLARCIIGAALLTAMACHKDAPLLAVAYYSSFGGKGVPHFPVDQINQAEAERLESYLIARRNENGQLVSLEKILRGKRFFLQECYYDDRGRVTKVSLESDGVIVTREFGRE